MKSFRLKNVKTNTKLILVFGTIIIVAGFTGILGVVSKKPISYSIKRNNNKITIPVTYLTEIATDFQKIRALLRDMIIETDAKIMKTYNTEIEKLKQRIEKYCSEYEKLMFDVKGKKLYNYFIDAKKNFFKHFGNKLLQLGIMNNEKEAIKVLRSLELKNANEKVTDAILKLVAFEKYSDYKKRFGG